MKHFLSLFTVLLSIFALNAQSCFTLQIENTNGAIGDTICLDVDVTDFNQILSMQHSFTWDPSLLELIEITNFNLPGLSINNFNTLPSSWNTGQSSISWYDNNLTGVSLPDETAIYTMCFEVLGYDNTGLASVMFTELPTPLEITDLTLLSASPYSLIHGGVQAGNNLFQIDSICVTSGSCNDKIIEVSFSGGQSPYTYNWGSSSGSLSTNTLSLTNTEPGIYTLQLTDANGKSVSALCDITSPDDFLITNIDIDEPTCNISNDASIILSLSGGSGNYDATWSNGMSGLNIQGLGLGSYSVTVTDLGTGCTIIENIDVQSTKDITTSTNYECMDSLLNLNIVVWEGGTPPYLFEWSTGLIDSASLFSSLQNVPDNVPYDVTVTSQEGCEKVVTFDSIDCQSLQADFIVAHSYQCEIYIDEPNRSDLSAVVWLGGIPPYTFQWSTGDVTVSTDPNVPVGTLEDLYDGTYYVTITDSQGMMDVYGPMEIDCDGDGTQLFTTYTTDCLTDSTATVSLNAHGGTAPYTFEWEDGTTQTHPSMSLVTLADNSTYSLTITDSDGNVLVEDVQVNCNAPSFLIASSYECTIFPDSTIADVSVIVWTGGTLPYTFEWSTGETQVISDPNLPIGTITGDGNGTYFVTITDANGYSEPYGPITPNCSNSLLPVELMAASANVGPNESFCVDVTVANFNDVVGFQFSMDWNADTLTFDTLLLGAGLPGLDLTDFNLNNTSSGSLVVQWFNPTLEQISLADNTVLFSLCFEAGASPGSTNIAFSPTPALIEVTDGDMILPVDLTNGLVNVEGSAQLSVTQTIDCLSDSTATVTANAIGGTAPYTFEWEDGTTQTDPSTSMVTLTGNGIYSLTITDANGDVLIEDIEVDCTPSFLIASSYECTIFPDSTIADVSVIVWTGGTLPYTFEWSTGETQVISDPNLPIGTITGDGNGTYFVTITDANGYSELYGPITPNCSDLAPVELMAASANVGPNESFCVDVTVANFNDVVGFQFSMDWNADTLTFDTLLLGAGLTGFDLTDFNLNNTSSGSLVVQWFNPTLEQISLADNTVLFSLCFEAGASPGSTDIAFTSTPALIEVTDGDMILPVDLTNGEVVIGGTGQLIVNTTVDCLSDSTATVTANAIGGTAPYTFEWEDGTTQTDPSTSTVTLTGNGTYSLTITDANGDVLIEDIEVDCTPSFLIAHSYECMIFSDSTIADISVVVWTGGTLPYTFEWSTGETQVISDPNLPIGTITADGNGTYYVTITDANGYSEIYGPITPNCGGLAPVELMAGSADVGPNESFCVDVTVANFNDVVGFQFSMDWNADTLTFDTLLLGSGLPGFDVNDFNLNNTSLGSLVVQWFNPTLEQVSLPDNTVLFSLCFEAGASPGSTNIAFTSTPALIEVTDGDMILPVSTTNGMVNVGGGDPSFILADSYQCNIFPDTTIADVSVIVWAGGTLPYTFEWSTGETQVITDPLMPVGTTTGDGDGIYYVTITDANGYAEVYGPITPNCSGPAAVEFIAESVDVQPNESFCVDVSVAQFNNVVGMQFSMDWNSDTLIFDTLLVGNSLTAFDVNSFNLSNTTVGSLNVQWFNPSLQEVDLPDNTVLFSLCFDASASEGSSEVAFVSIPTAIEVTDGNTILPIQLTNGTVNVLGPEVWPGDTDNDEGVDHYDLLNIGLAYGATGPARDNPSIIWQGYYADDWGLTTPESLVDYKHIDTNGDGFIDAADTLALVLNWGEESNFNEPEEEEVREANGIIYVQPDTILLGEEAVMNIIMEQGGTPVEDVYGIAFTIVYDTTAVEAESVYASFEESWIGEVNQDLLSFYVDRYDDSRIDIAMTRIDGFNTSGEGVIGQLHITIQDVIFMREDAYEMFFDIENVRLINFMEQESNLAPQQTTTFIRDAVSNTHLQDKKSTLLLYPNPSTDIIHLLTQANIENVAVYNLQGQMLMQAGNTNRIAVNHLDAGTYLLKAWTNEGFYVKRFSVLR